MKPNPNEPNKNSKPTKSEITINKEINLDEVATELQRIINSLDKNTDIKKLGNELLDILRDIYFIINKKEKDDKSHSNSSEKEKSLDSLNINNSNNNNINKNHEMAGLDKDNIKKNRKFGKFN